MSFKVKSSKRERYKKTAFTLWDYNTIGLNYKLSDKERYIYMQFMNDRFPKENDELYAREWAERFERGNPKVYMDSDSLKSYEKAEKSWKEMMKEK